MPIPPERRLAPTTARRFGRYAAGALIEPDSLSELHRRAYERFLQPDTPPERREAVGLEAVFREAFPIRGDGARSLHYLHYELGEPLHSLDECRRRRLTYARPLLVHLRLEAEESIAERVEMGAIPILIGGGEFLINGSERIIVGQLARAPGIEFTLTREGDQVLHSCRIVPLRGGRLTIAVTRRGTLEAHLGHGCKLPAFTLLRALDPGLSTDGDLLASLHPIEMSAIDATTLDGRISAVDFIDPQTGEVYLDAGRPWTAVLLAKARSSGLQRVAVLAGRPDPLLLNALADDPTSSHEEALAEVYRRANRGMPIDLDRARRWIEERFHHPERYHLGQAGRMRLDSRLGLTPNTEDRGLCGRDLAAALRYLFGLRAGKGSIDNIDHLANRRVRLLDELLADELRKGLLKLRRVVAERLRKADTGASRPSRVVQHRAVSAALEYFFSRSSASQLADQTNPLALLTHRRRLSAIGPGRVDRKRASFSARDLHLSHHGRVCPIETPEGEAIGLILHLALHARIDEHGFLLAPYREVAGRQLGDRVVPLRAEEEERLCIAAADTPNDGRRLTADRVIARKQGDFAEVSPDEVTHIGVAPAQMVGVSAALIPFLEHDDANRALMGANMQRQAVPLLIPEPPLVGTGIEAAVGRQAALVLHAEQAGVVTGADANHIRIGERVYRLTRFMALNGGACQKHKPLVKPGDRVSAGQVIADGAATQGGELALGRNVLAAFMPWEGYNFEDAIVLSERLLHADVFTSIHIEEFDAELLDNRLGKEEFTAKVPGAPARALMNLDESGIVRLGTRVRAGGILVGKTVPRQRTEVTREMRLLHGLFGRGEERSNDSLEVPGGVEGIVIDVRREKREDGLDLGPGVIERVRVRLAAKRQISVGDKMAGRHGNKGVISKILPVEDMPYMADGTPVDILLNPLGVPSRMNVGQILETHLGWAAAKLGFKAITPVFDGASEEEIRKCLKEAGLPETGKSYLYDGRTGERFEQPVTVGYIYMLKLHHLVDDKVHARATGPYSLITQQPLGGKARFGGQRLGEMEVWALEAHGAANILQEMLTVKSDDVEGRTRTYEALLRGEELPSPGSPASLEVLRQELRGLGLDLTFEKE